MALKALSACVASVAVAGLLPSVASADQPKTVAQAQAQIDALDNQAEIASEQFNAAQARLTQARQLAAAAESAAGTAHAALATERLKVGALAAAAYTTGGIGENVVAVTLTTGDPATAAQKLAMLRQLGDRQAQVLRAADVASLQYEQALTAASERTAAADSLAAGIATQQKKIDGLIAQSQAVLTQLSAAERAKLLAAQRAQAAIEQAKAATALAAWKARAVRPVARAVTRPAVVAAAQPIAAPVAAPEAAVQSTGSSAADRAVAAAMSKLGSRYVYGAGGANTFDCSGLVQWAYGRAGISTAHFTGSFWASYRHVSTDELRPGDLVFFYADKHHVGIYIGGGMMVNAPHTGDVVRVAPVFGGGRDYVGAVRVVG